VLTGGTGADKFVYNAITDSTPAVKDTVNSFTTGSDKLDFTAISGFNGATVQVVTGGSPPSTVAAHTIDLYQNAGNTEVYANASAGSEAVGAVDMQIHLVGVTVATTDILHA
jgi:serralysin